MQLVSINHNPYCDIQPKAESLGKTISQGERKVQHCLNQASVCMLILNVEQNKNMQLSHSIDFSPTFGLQFSAFISVSYMEYLIAASKCR